MLLSIVTGTHQRRVYLAQFVNSVRVNIPRGLPYEIIVVDGGSTDGTLDWCRQQPDIVLIEQGELLGAIRAFDAGAYAAQGDFVLLGNDDTVLHPNSIIPAIVYLETHLTVGAIAYLDNRPAPGYTDGYKTQNISVRDTDGKVIQMPYPQVGMIRRWLGNEALWWGSRHPIMGTGHTYGGDSWLGARIYERGYTIGVLDACKVDDLIPADDLREHNNRVERANPAVYYKAFPNPPQFVQPPALPNPQRERLRILYLPIYERGNSAQQAHKRGLREALMRRGLVYEIDYVNTRYDLAEVVKMFQPHLLLMQIHGFIPIDKLRDARAAHQSMTVVNWNGDVHERHLTSPEALAFLKHVDLQLTVNENVLPVYAEHGINAAYWQVSFEPVDYAKLPAVPRHDVVLLANAYTDERKQLGNILQSMPGVNVGLYGHGWQWANGECMHNFPVGAALYQNAKIAVGDSQYQAQHGFVSNRLFEALASGAFLLHQVVPGLDRLTGLQDGAHYISWGDLQDLQEKIRYWLQPRREEKRAQIAREGRDYVRANHSFQNRVDELLKLLERIGEKVA